jgi:hypothetical protein
MEQGLNMGEWVNESRWIDGQFVMDARLGIAVPCLTAPWEKLGLERRSAVLARWEEIRGRIPDRVAAFEAIIIREKQVRLFEVEDFASCCRLNDEIAELASRINDLNIWYRTEQDFEEETRRHG